VFDGLVSVTFFGSRSHSLTRIPSIKNMGKLESFLLQSNKITEIASGAFKGAPNLLSLSLGNNVIVSVAPDAFDDLTMYHVSLDAWVAEHAGATPYSNSIGIGLWPHFGKGHFHGANNKTTEYAYPAIGYNPNPSECRWVGPLASNISCTVCALGYEAASANDTTCVKPPFKTYRGWAGSPEKTRLTVRDNFGRALKQSGGADAPALLTEALLTEHAYTIPAPMLMPKERKFAGYTQPYSKIVRVLPSPPLLRNGECFGGVCSCATMPTTPHMLVQCVGTVPLRPVGAVGLYTSSQ